MSAADHLTLEERATVRELRRCRRVPHVEQMLAIIDRLAPPPAHTPLPQGLDFYDESFVVEEAGRMREVVERCGGQYIEDERCCSIALEGSPAPNFIIKSFVDQPPRMARRLVLQWLRARLTGSEVP